MVSNLYSKVWGAASPRRLYPGCIYRCGVCHVKLSDLIPFRNPPPIMSICPLVDIRRELPVLPVLVRVTSICLLKFCGSQAYKDSGRRPLTPPNLSLYTSRLQRPNNENDYPSTEYQVKAHWRFIAASWLRIVAPLIFGRMGLILGGKLIITLLQIKL
jgi:hypothetical protein